MRVCFFSNGKTVVSLLNKTSFLIPALTLLLFLIAYPRYFRFTRIAIRFVFVLDYHDRAFTIRPRANGLLRLSAMVLGIFVAHNIL